MNRRDFLKLSLASALLSRPAWSADSDARIEILLDEPIGTIAPEIYGHFTEHLGGVIYDGVWVGPNSKIPNVGGIRLGLVERLKRIGAAAIRWPGGCFADSYDWRDGIGAKRPLRANFWGGDESNAFGTDEFIQFCRLSGARPYLAANLRSLPAEAFMRWVEYCNAPNHAARQGGPYNVDLWGVGNESWGCGGNFSAEDYASEYMRFTSYVPNYGRKLELIAAGPGGDDRDWTHRFFEALKRKTSYSPPLTGWSCHHYVDDLDRGRTGKPVKGDALVFDKEDWIEELRLGQRTETIITSQWDILGQYDPEHKIKLVVDEYGAWYKPGSEAFPTHTLGQQSTLRDAVLTAMTLDIFNRHADKVEMANCAQLVNCLNALFLAHEDKFVETPVFHVFDLYRPHHGAQSLRTTGLTGSASRQGGKICVTAVNISPTEASQVEIALRGATIGSANGAILTDSALAAHNDFAHPDRLKPRPFTPEIRGGRLHALLPAASVGRFDIVIG